MVQRPVKPGKQVTRRSACGALACIGAVLIVLSGCVERELFIHTDPPAASMNLDGRDYGETPVAIPFHYYGTRALELRLEGHRVKRTLIAVEEPWYQYFPLDLFFDVLWPFTIKDNQVFFIELEPVPEHEPVDRAEILERAGKLRNETLGTGG